MTLVLLAPYFLFTVSSFEYQSVRRLVCLFVHAHATLQCLISASRGGRSDLSGVVAAPVVVEPVRRAPAVLLRPVERVEQFLPRRTAGDAGQLDYGGQPHYFLRRSSDGQRARGCLRRGRVVRVVDTKKYICVRVSFHMHRCLLGGRGGRCFLFETGVCGTTQAVNARACTLQR